MAICTQLTHLTLYDSRETVRPVLSYWSNYILYQLYLHGNRGKLDPFCDFLKRKSSHEGLNIFKLPVKFNVGTLNISKL